MKRARERAVDFKHLWTNTQLSYGILTEVLSHKPEPQVISIYIYECLDKHCFTYNDAQPTKRIQCFVIQHRSDIIFHFGKIYLY